VTLKGGERPPEPKDKSMRKLSAGLFHSVDGVVEAPNLWQFDAFDAELGATMGKMMGAVDTVLLGRRGYEDWAQYWPNAEGDQDFAGFINNVPKYVASRTLTGPLGWQNSTLIEGDLGDFVRKLKAGEGGEIQLMGGISLVREMLFAGLLDSLTLITHPVVAGAGRRHLFEPGDPTTRLQLQEAVVTSKGNVVATYGVRGDA
jgi:dihydrofolate reductase